MEKSKQNSVKKVPTVDDIIKLYLSKDDLTLRCLDVVESLNTELNETRGVMDELEKKGILCRLTAPIAGHTTYIINPPSLWQDEELEKKYASRFAPKENQIKL